MIFVLLILSLLLGYFVVVKKRKNENPKQTMPPGPWGLPLLGHLVSLGLNPHLTLMKWKQKYGPIISCRFGSFPTVVLGDSKVIKEAFNMLEFAGRPSIQVFVEQKATNGISLSKTSYNAELRHFAIRKLKEFGMGKKSLEDQIQDGISEFLDFIKKREGQAITSKDIPSAHFIRTLWSIMMTDELNPADVERVNQILKKFDKLGPILSELAGFMPWMEKMARILSFGRYSLISTRTQEVQAYVSFFAEVLVEKKRSRSEARARGQVEEPRDIMDFYLEKVEETTDIESPFHASHGSASFFLADIFGAGIHTIQTTLIWMLYYAARNPDVQLKLQEEIDKVTGFGNLNSNSKSRLPSLSDRGQMPYADAVVHELLRKSSVLPLALPHQVTKDLCFHGYTIKKDTMVFANVYGVHHDPDVWTDPENFRPERWLGESGKRLKSEHFIPFTTGRRSCVGEAMGREQLFLYVTTLFQRYSVNFHGDASQDVKEAFGLFLGPSQFTVKFAKREIKPV